MMPYPCRSSRESARRMCRTAGVKGDWLLMNQHYIRDGYMSNKIIQLSSITAVCLRSRSEQNPQELKFRVSPKHDPSPFLEGHSKPSGESTHPQQTAQCDLAQQPRLSLVNREAKHDHRELP